MVNASVAKEKQARKAKNILVKIWRLTFFGKSAGALLPAV
jgi:hypothetical protein